MFIPKFIEKKIEDLSEYIWNWVQNFRWYVKLILGLILLFLIVLINWQKIKQIGANYNEITNTTKPRKVSNISQYQFKFVNFDNIPFKNGTLLVNGNKILPDSGGVFSISKDLITDEKRAGTLIIDKTPCYNRDLPIPTTENSLILIKIDCP